MIPQSPILVARSISKRFGSVKANDQVDFALYPGQVHALLGENGAGKSTLMNILCGLYRSDEGTVTAETDHIPIRDPKTALKNGICMVHQHFMLVPTLSVAENIILGHEPTRGPWLDLKRANRRIADVSHHFGLNIDPETRIEDLSAGMQQRVEIVKALYHNAKVLILDEPTALLTPQETDDFFGIVRGLAAAYVAIGFITHKLDEVLKISDRISVMRKGRIVATADPKTADADNLAAMMVGRQLSGQISQLPQPPGKAVLELKGLTVYNRRHLKTVCDVSFGISAGEILGLTGVSGSGQSELALAIAGMIPLAAGHIYLNGQKAASQNPRSMMENGLSHIPEDRQKYGLVLSHTIADNQVLCNYYKPPFARFLWRNLKAVHRHSKDLIKAFDIRDSDSRFAAGTLSGGNQQKVILSRELSRKASFLLAHNPTRGLDVGVIQYIHQKLIALRDSGSAILLISSDLDEILKLADRVAVMYNGRIKEAGPVAETTKSKLGRLMAGIGFK